MSVFIFNLQGIVEKEVQMKERLLSSRYNEERLKLQQHHDEVLQKVLYKLNDLFEVLVHFLFFFLIENALQRTTKGFENNKIYQNKRRYFLKIMSVNQTISKSTFSQIRENRSVLYAPMKKLHSHY